MYTIFILYILGYIFFVFFNHYLDEEWSFAVFLLPIIQGLLFAIAGLFIAWMLPMHYVTKSWQENIVTLKDNNNVDGTFFLGSGIIEGRMRYVFYIQNDDSTYVMRQCDYSEAAIKYTNGKPKADVTTVDFDNCLWNEFAIDLADERSNKVVFEVPRGSIKNTYELDAQ